MGTKKDTYEQNQKKAIKISRAHDGGGLWEFETHETYRKQKWEEETANQLLDDGGTRLGDLAKVKKLRW